MAPMNWLLLLMFFIIIMIVMVMINYYMMQPYIMLNSKQSHKINFITWKW